MSCGLLVKPPREAGSVLRPATVPCRISFCCACGAGERKAARTLSARAMLSQDKLMRHVERRCKVENPSLPSEPRSASVELDSRERRSHTSYSRAVVSVCFKQATVF
jgi:hypothetical protein